MKKSSIVCEGCAHEQQTEPPRYGGRFSWIILTKPPSMSGEKFDAGEHHFCSEECLSKALAKTPSAVVSKKGF
jgi:hypothetical protein